VLAGSLACRHIHVQATAPSKTNMTESCTIPTLIHIAAPGYVVLAGDLALEHIQVDVLAIPHCLDEASHGLSNSSDPACQSNERGSMKWCAMYD